MAINRQKISQMTPKGSNLDPTDLMEVSVQTGSGYETFSITGQEIINSASGGALDLQAVTDNGNTTTNEIIVTDNIDQQSIVNNNYVTAENNASGTYATIDNQGILLLGNGLRESELKNTNVTNYGVRLEFPDKPTGSYTIATTSDLTGGTVTSVGLSAPSAFNVTNSPVTGSGTLTLSGAGTISQYIDGTGSLQTMPSGLPPTGTAGGDLNGSYPNPTVDGIHGIDMQSGIPTSGDVWVYGGSPAKWQHQMLHASQVDNDSAVTGTHVDDALNTLNTNKVNTSRTISTTSPLSGGGDLTTNRTLSISQSTTSTDGYISSTDWNTFNNKQAALVSGTNIKTINSNSILGSGNISVGTVTSVTGTTPISSSGGTTPAISIVQATTSTDGYLSSTDWNTFNNKASYTPRVQNVTSASNVTPTASNDIVIVTAQAAALNFVNPTGSWSEGQSLMLRIKDNGTARAITYDTNYRAIGVTLPTTTVISKTTYIGIIYNSVDGKWDVIGVTTQA